MKTTLSITALAVLLIAAGGYRTSYSQEPISDRELFRQGYLLEDEHFIRQLGSTEMTVLFFSMPNSQLEAQPYLNLDTNLPPVSHSQAIDLALRSAGKDCEQKKYYVESCTLSRLTAETENSDNPDWNWGHGRFYWDVNIQFYNENDKDLSLDASMPVAVLMDGGVLAPVERVMPAYKGNPECCDHKMRSVFCAIALYKLREGEFPNTLNDLIRIASPAERRYVTETFRCSDDQTDFVYSKPPADPDPGFVLLKCPRHKEHGFNVQQIEEALREIQDGDEPCNTTFSFGLI